MFDATQQDVSLGLAHMFDATEHWGGVGWGGVGMLTFLAHAHMLDATQQDVSLGVAHMIDATQQDVSLGLAHMFDATEHWGGVGWGC